jgi:hypothetical protein
LWNSGSVNAMSPPGRPPRNAPQGDVPYVGPDINLYAQVPTAFALTALAH